MFLNFKKLTFNLVSKAFRKTCVYCIEEKKGKMMSKDV